MFRLIAGLLALVLLEASRFVGSESSAKANDEGTDYHDEKLEEMWIVEVIERSSDRTIADIADIDSMATGLLAVQAAIYALGCPWVDERRRAIRGQACSTARRCATPDQNGMIER